MRQRCSNPNNADFRWYGKLGIKLCEEWDDFSSFDKWALENGYSHGLTIDRVDCNGDYCPNNCRWITIADQQKSKRNRTMLTYKGRTKSVIEWSEETGISLNVFHDRIHRNWTPERIIETPNRGPGKYERRRSYVS